MNTNIPFIRNSTLLDGVKSIRKKWRETKNVWKIQKNFLQRTKYDIMDDTNKVRTIVRPFLENYA